MKMTLPILAAALLASACNAADAPADNADSDQTLPPGNALPPPEIDVVPPSETVTPTDAWTGKWTGPEGLALDIQPGAAPGRYTIAVTLLDGTNSYEGAAERDVIRFTRNGEEETIRAATGDETGLKYLAGKQDCLMIEQAEGFCRD